MNDDNDSQFSFSFLHIFLLPYYFAYFIIPRILSYAVSWIEEQLGID